MQLEQRCRDLVHELALADPAEVLRIVPLTGGVASDIAMVDLGARKICAKFALPKLKVAADWRAPVHRNGAEYAWLSVAAAATPRNAVQLYGRSATAHGFAMEYLEGPDVYLWKDHLLREAPIRGEAQGVATLLGTIQAVSSKPVFDRTPFDNRNDFHALRIEPYLSHTRKAHPALAPHIAALEGLLGQSEQVLVHGDASPKNILLRGRAPILLDAECATMGDACFDPAFCLNHLVLKAVHLPGARAQLLAQLSAFWQSYAAHVVWEDAGALERRVCALLPALMLARVDGKSPVEYLSEAARQAVRDVSIPLITRPLDRLDQIADHITTHLSGRTL